MDKTDYWKNAAKVHHEKYLELLHDMHEKSNEMQKHYVVSFLCGMASGAGFATVFIYLVMVG